MGVHHRRLGRRGCRGAGCGGGSYCSSRGGHPRFRRHERQSGEGRARREFAYLDDAELLRADSCRPAEPPHFLRPQFSGSPQARCEEHPTDATVHPLAREDGWGQHLGRKEPVRLVRAHSAQRPRPVDGRRCASFSPGVLLSDRLSIFPLIQRDYFWAVSRALLDAKVSPPLPLRLARFDAS